jgi:L-threonylcarbamoyladenylate synthase
VSTTTRFLRVDPRDPDPATLEQAALVLIQGGLVAFATETVYGLGADATSPAAVARIFAAKGRPAFNPLIVHADTVEMARSCVREWPEEAVALVGAFWPGPLTLVLPRSAIIPDVVTAGRDTVGVRIPAPAVARRLIAHAGRPVAAPSANRSNAISPTLAEHVRGDLDGRVDLILDSGQAAVGLESTVLDLTSRHPRVLRPGPIDVAAIEAILPGRRVEISHESSSGSDPRNPASPGQLAVHYAPRTPALRLDAPADLDGFPWCERPVLLVVGRHTLSTLPPGLRRFDLETPEAAARELYAVLHRCDALDVGQIVVLPPPAGPEWQAVRDRLLRATRPFASWRPKDSG